MEGKETFPKRHPVWTVILTLATLVLSVSAIGACASTDEQPISKSKSTNTSADTASAQTTPVDPSNPANPDDESDTEEAPSAPKPSKPKPSKPDMTAGQENALESAHSYIDGQAFSKKGLIEQLSSEYGEDFSKADATFAANHVGADRKAEAVESAEGYLDGQSFSKAGLIEQLTSSYGEGFTPEQARYAVGKVYR
jgi:hypothetical protein